MEKRRCITCKELRTVDNFVKDKNKPGGLRTQCKDCTRAYQRQHRKNNPESARRRSRRYSERNKTQMFAKRAVENAIRRRRLAPQGDYTCSNPTCTHSAEHYHHWSYEKEHWLSVIPLCASCHLGLHGRTWTLNNPQKYIVSPNEVVTG